MKQWIRYAIAFLLALGMFGVSQLLGEREIVFPEILAVALGALCMDRQPWRIGRPWMVLFMTGAAFAGVGVVRFLPLPLSIQAIIGFALVACCQLASGFSMAPMLSACILPMYLHTVSLVYPLSVAMMMGILVLVQWGMERAGIRRPAEPFFRLSPSRGRCMAWGMVLAVFALLESAVMASGKVCLMVPPLIVSLVEGCFHDWTGTRIRIFLAISGCACAGALVQLLLADRLGWPLPASGAVAIILVFGILVLGKVSFPPACAIGLLPFLLPREELSRYPVLVAAGCGVILLVTRWLHPIVVRLLERETTTAA